MSLKYIEIAVASYTHIRVLGALRRKKKKERLSVSDCRSWAFINQRLDKYLFIRKEIGRASLGGMKKEQLSITDGCSEFK